jgi:predicted DNA-binding protein (UPF0251 family)
MNELIQRLIDKTGLSQEQAASAMQIVLGFVKEKLPAPVAMQVESILTGGADGGTALGDIGGALGGMFGKN